MTLLLPLHAICDYVKHCTLFGSVLQCCVLLITGTTPWLHILAWQDFNVILPPLGKEYGYVNCCRLFWYLLIIFTN